MGQKKFGSKKILGPKNFVSKIIIGPRKFLVQKILGLKRILGPKKYGSEKILCATIIFLVCSVIVDFGMVLLALLVTRVICTPAHNLKLLVGQCLANLSPISLKYLFTRSPRCKVIYNKTKRPVRSIPTASSNCYHVQYFSHLIS